MLLALPIPVAADVVTDVAVLLLLMLLLLLLFSKQIPHACSPASIKWTVEHVAAVAAVSC